MRVIVVVNEAEDAVQKIFAINKSAHQNLSKVEPALEVVTRQFKILDVNNI